MLENDNIILLLFFTLNFTRWIKIDKNLIICDKFLLKKEDNLTSYRFFESFYLNNYLRIYVVALPV